MGKFDDKVVWITGGARGQGRSHAQAFAREGADIVICDVPDPLPTVPYPVGTAEDMAETVALVEAEGRKCLALKGDVRDGAQMRNIASEAMAAFGRIDVHIANAGILSLAESTWETSDEDWQEMIDVNLTGVWQSCKAAIPHILAGGRGGSIIMTASIAAMRGVAGCTHYTAAKHGVVGLMRTLAWELASENVTVNAVVPTGVNSPMSNNDFFGRWLDEHPKLADAMRGNLIDIEQLPASHVSGAMVWLASEEGRYVTGVTLPIDAGFLIK
jgi:SDR family mycofactocin-dependent oxidoreductase